MLGRSVSVGRTLAHKAHTVVERRHDEKFNAEIIYSTSESLR
jgi:hypothetical protein